jgi:hypothetical protein
MSDSDAVPEPGAAEEMADRVELAVPEDSVEAEASEADLLDQARVVEEEQRVARSERRDDVPEADWLEQSVVESYGYDER